MELDGQHHVAKGVGVAFGAVEAGMDAIGKGVARKPVVFEEIRVGQNGTEGNGPLRSSGFGADEFGERVVGFAGRTGFGRLERTNHRQERAFDGLWIHVDERHGSMLGSRNSGGDGIGRAGAACSAGRFVNKGGSEVVAKRRAFWQAGCAKMSGCRL